MESEAQKILKEISFKVSEIRKRKCMVKGTINKIYTKCGNPNCKCARGEKHGEHRLTYKGKDAISKTVYLNRSKIEKVEKMIKNYQEVKLLLNEILELNVKLIKMD